MPDNNVDPLTNSFDYQQGFKTLSAVLARRTLAGVMGKSFGGDRDIYEAVGYPKDPIGIEELFAKYYRGSVAGRIVDKPVGATWNRPPRVYDGATEKEGKTDTTFVKDLDKLATRLRLWAILAEADKEASVGRYGVVVIGVRGRGRLNEPIRSDDGKPVKIKGDDVLYMSAFSELAAKVVEVETNEESDRFGLPTFYEVDFSEDNFQSVAAAVGKKRVHWSRVAHISEGVNKVVGRSALERPYNRLEDIERLAAGVSEAAWRLAYKGAVIEALPEFDITQTAQELRDASDEMLHYLRRTLVLEGAKYVDLGGEIPDPSGVFEMLQTLIASDSDIPQRILFGSERGELASTADQDNWQEQIDDRRLNHVEPNILAPVINWLVAYGAISPPQSGNYGFIWSPLYSKGERAEAEVRGLNAQAMATAAAAALNGVEVTPQELRMFGGLSPEPDPSMKSLSLHSMARALVAAARLKTHANGKGGDLGRALFTLIEGLPEEITEGDIDRALEQWDRDFPEAAGLLDALI